jgi:vesicle-fusing ATPase
MAGISDDVDNLRVNRADFLNALEEVKPAFGVSEEELAQVIQNEIIRFDPFVDVRLISFHPPALLTLLQEILNSGHLFVEQVRESKLTHLVSVLLHGPPGSGKTALAATIAQKSDYPFIKLITPDSMVGFSEAQKVSAINKVFADSYKSPLSIIVVDNLERLIGKDYLP